MKLSRRNFIALGAGVAAGGAAGTLLSPLPWKLTDDLAIWTQHWPGTPVAEGGPEYAESAVCGLCPGACGLSLRRLGQRLAGVSGRAGYPVNNGGICPLGGSATELLYGPTRLRSPMVSAGKRGEGRWKEVSWKEAVKLAAGRLSELRAKGACHKAGLITGPGQSLPTLLFKRFIQAYGSNNAFWPITSFGTYSWVIRQMHGVDAAPGFDIENSDFVLSFGAGLLEGFAGPVASIKGVSGLRDKGGILVQVSPRLSNTAAKADQWVAVKPGSEAALALGVANVLIKERLADPAVIAAAANFAGTPLPDGKVAPGYSGLILANYTPQRVSALTGLQVQAIIDLARAFGRAKKPLAVWGRGRGDGAGLVSECMAVHGLNVLKARVNAEGGLFLRKPDALPPWQAPFFDQAALQGFQKGRVDFAGTRRFPLAESVLSNLPALMAESGEGLSALLVYDADPFHDLAGAGKARDILGKTPFIATFATHLSDTAMMSDLVFPVNFFLEDWHYAPTPPGYVKRCVSLSKPAIPPVFNTRPAGEAIMAIAKAMGGTMARSFHWTDFCVAMAEAIGNELETLKADGNITADATVEPGASVDFMPSLTHRFISGELVLSPDHEAPVLPGNKTEFPLVAIPTDSLKLPVGPVAGSHLMVKALSGDVLLKNSIFVEVNPLTAQKLGLSDGKAATISTPSGTAEVLVKVTEGIMPDIIGVPRGLGHRGYDAFLDGRGVNWSELAAVAPDPVTGKDAAYGVRASLTRMAV